MILLKDASHHTPTGRHNLLMCGGGVRSILLLTFVPRDNSASAMYTNYNNTHLRGNTKKEPFLTIRKM